MEEVFSKTGFERFSNLELFYTKPEIAQICIDKFNNKVSVSDNDLIIEPSAGSGDFLSIINSTFTCSITAFDTSPRDTSIIERDFLTVNFDDFSEYNNIHVIGNPPFGRQSNTVCKFIKHMKEHVNTISFILPKSFKKNSVNKIFGHKFHLIEEYDLPKNSFYLLNGKNHDVPTVFQIWKKQLINRDLQLYIEPIGFMFCKKEIADFSFRRVGMHAGDIDINITDKSIQSHYFIKLNDEYLSKKMLIYNQLKNINFDCNNTVGPKSINKYEITEKYNPIFEING